MAENHYKKNVGSYPLCQCGSQGAGGNWFPSDCGGKACTCCNSTNNNIDRNNMKGYKQNRAEKSVPKKFGKRNQPLQPQTSAGTSYIVNTEGSGNTPERVVSLFPDSTDILMTRNK
tara:strand:+ start:432 stop:779 length:348 start_codon:yes stop_codon:yes gene_type:complete